MSERLIPKNRDEALSMIESEWNALMVVIESLDERKMLVVDAGGWTPKDNIAHLTEWMRALLGYHLDGRPSHEVLGLLPEQTEQWDFNAVNAALLEKNRSLSVDEAISGLKDACAQVVKRINDTPFEDFLKPRFPNEAESLPILNWVLANTTEHFAEHRAAIEKTR